MKTMRMKSNNHEPIKTMGTKTSPFIPLLILMLLLGGRSFAQGVGISEISITPDASAVLEVRSSSRGLMIPRLLNSSISSPQRGLLIYDGTTDGQLLSFYNGSWISLAPLVSPSFTTPSLGVASATTVNKVTLTTPATGSTLTIADGKVFTASNTLTLTGTDGSTLNIGAGGALGSNAFSSTAFAPLASPTFTGTVIIPTPFTLGATSVTSTGTQLNYLSSANGTSGTTNTNIVFSTAPTLTGTTLAAGTATVDPMTFTSGTNLTTPAAGSMEYDGNTMYSTPSATSGRGVIPSVLFTTGRNAAPVSSNTAQNWFVGATDAISVVAVTYLFEAVLNVSATGATSNSLGISILGGGTAVVSSIAYSATTTNGTAATPNTASQAYISSAANTAVTAAVAAATNRTVVLKGIIRIGTSGTLIPTFTFSAAPTGTVALGANNYMILYPIGTNTVVSSGIWN